jgi:hypothetical protein
MDLRQHCRLTRKHERGHIAWITAMIVTSRACGRCLDAVLIAEILGSLVLAGLFELARASTVKLFLRDGQWWSQGSWVTAILWVLSLAAHLGFDYLAGGHLAGGHLAGGHLAGGHGTGGASFGSATILLYLAVTFRSRSPWSGWLLSRVRSACRFPVRTRSPAWPDPPRTARGVAGGVPRAWRSA